MTGDKHLQAMLQKWGIVLVLILAVMLLGGYLAASLAATSGVLGVPLDDAWIHYQFARNLSQGDGFSYIPGVPTAGSTAPLWTLLLAGVGLIAQNFLVPSLLLSAGFFLLTVWLTYRLAETLVGRWQMGLLAAVGVALAGRMAWAGLSAMEATLFAALSLAAVWAYHLRGLRPSTAILFGLASLARPEGHLLFALAGFDTLLSFRYPPPLNHAPRPTWRALFGAVLVYGLLSAPYALFSLSVTGRPLPNTFYAKSHTNLQYSLRTLRETLLIHWRDNPLSMLLLPFGFVFLWRRNRLVGLWTVGLMAAVPLIVPFLWHHGRYTLPLIPFQMILAAAGVYWLGQKMTARWGERAAAGTAVLVFLLLLGGAWGLPRWAAMLGSNAREVQEIDVAMGRWLAEHIPAGEAVAVDDIGAIMFYSPRPLVDLHGLVSPEMWPVMADADPDAATVRLLADANVAYLAIFPGWHAALLRDPAMTQPIQRFTTGTRTIIGETEAVIYEVTWPYQDAVTPENEREALLGEGIRLRGYGLDGDELRLYWESVTAVPDSYKVFIHFRNEDGEIAGQIDRLPAAGFAPTNRWRPGEFVVDRYAIPPLPPGAYEIWVGMYTEADGRLTAVGTDVADDAILLTAWEIFP